MTGDKGMNGWAKIITVILALIYFGWKLGAQANALENLENRFNKFEQLMDDRYRGSDATRDFDVRDGRISDNQKKIDKHIDRHAARQ